MRKPTMLLGLCWLGALSACAEVAGSGGTGGDGAGSASGGADATSGPGSGGSVGGATSVGGAGVGGGGAPAGLVPMFIAQGHMGRTTVSCDDGKSWIANRSDDDTIRCFEGIDCDHGPEAGRGLAYGAGLWVATFGWGAPGKVKTSVDGVTWETVLTDTGTFADIAFGHDMFVANAGVPLLSSDGMVWSDSPGNLDLNINTRAIGYSPAMGGRFIVTGESGTTRDIVLSADDGKTWTHATTRPEDCISYVRGIGSSDSTIVLVSGNGHVCTSTDGGDAWTRVALTDGFTAGPLWTGTEFLAWNRNVLYRSPDGLTWANSPTTPTNVSIGAVARSPDGTLVASNDGWMQWYEDQAFYRSTDGLTWEVLDAGSFTGSHPINFIEFGYAKPSAECPLP